MGTRVELELESLGIGQRKDHSRGTFPPFMSTQQLRAWILGGLIASCVNAIHRIHQRKKFASRIFPLAVSLRRISLCTCTLTW
ncbi:hypothetical protein L208DRAFT_1397848 [Tricholoma matsutake]|nr:hypothetical protein L208DRAFT_1397848 [Tricholoma matsutake 945]